MSLTLRDYQQAAIAASLQSEWQRQLIVLSTGLGKTITGLALAKQIGKRTLWLAHTEELIMQPAQAAKLVWPEATLGIVKAERNEFMRDVVFASVQSAQQERRTAQLAAQGFGFVVVDEAHHALSDGYQRILQSIGCFTEGGPRLLGLTATPERSDNGALEDVFQGIVYQMGIAAAIEQGYLVPPNVIERPINVDLDAVTISRGDFGQKQLDTALMQAGIVGEITAAYEEHCTTRKALIFVISVAQAEAVARELKSRGHAVVAVSGETDREERRRILKRLKSGELRAVVNCMVLTEGFDEPSVDAVILARPTQSKPLMIQKVGRGLRLYPGKRECLVIDMVGVSKRHTLVQAAVLFGLKPDPQERVSSGFDPIANPDEFWRSRMESQINGVKGSPRSALRWVPGDPAGWLLDAGIFGAVRMLPASDDLWIVDAVGIKVGAHKTQKLSQEPVAMDTAQALAEDYVRRVNAINKAVADAEWRNREVSQGQVKFLRRAGVPVTEGISAGTAADLELQVRAKQAVDPATPKQIYYLKSRGVKVPPNCTKREAQGLIVKTTFRKKAQ